MPSKTQLLDWANDSRALDLARRNGYYMREAMRIAESVRVRRHDIRELCRVQCERWSLHQRINTRAKLHGWRRMEFNAITRDRLSPQAIVVRNLINEFGAPEHIRKVRDKKHVRDFRTS